MHRIQKSNLMKQEPWEWITGEQGRLSGVRKWLLNGYLPFGRDKEENEFLQLYFYISLRTYCTGSVSERQQAQPKALGKLSGMEKGCVKSIMWELQVLLLPQHEGQPISNVHIKHIETDVFPPPQRLPFLALFLPPFPPSLPSFLVFETALAVQELAL